MHPIDLHTHSTKSDGTYTPTQLVRYAARKGLSAIALTDHDTVDGVEEAVQAAARLRRESESGSGSLPDPGSVPEVIPGVELSTEYNGTSVHVVGLFANYRDKKFVERLEEYSHSRIYRNKKMCRLLTEGGYPVSYEDLEKAFPDTVLTRPHFARYLLSQGMISSINEAFRSLIGDDCPYYVPRDKITPADAEQEKPRSRHRIRPSVCAGYASAASAREGTAAAPGVRSYSAGISFKYCIVYSE